MAARPAVLAYPPTVFAESKAALAVSNAKLAVAPDGTAEPFTTKFVAVMLVAVIELFVIVTVLLPTKTFPVTLKSPANTTLLVFAKALFALLKAALAVSKAGAT